MTSSRQGPWSGSEDSQCEYWIDEKLELDFEDTGSCIVRRRGGSSSDLSAMVGRRRRTFEVSQISNHKIADGATNQTIGFTHWFM